MFMRVYDSELKVIGEIDNISSLVYERGFFDFGSFEMHLPYSKEALELLKEENFLFLNNCRNKGMICEDFEISDGEKEIKVKGISLEGILGRRIVLPKTGENYLRFDNMAGSDIMVSLVESQCIEPEAPYRKMELLDLGESQKRGETISFRTGFHQLLSEVLSEIGRNNGLGYEITGDFQKRRLIFNLKGGKDLSSLQKEHPAVIFSEGYDNLSSVLYKEEGSHEKNAVYGVSGDVSLNQHLLYVSRNEKVTGIGLKEECIKSTGENALEISFDTDRRLLEAQKKGIVKAGIESTKAFAYEKDWQIGDIVTVVHEPAGKIIHERITKVREIYEQGQLRLEAVFGLEQSGFRQRIENIERKVRF